MMEHCPDLAKKCSNPLLHNFNPKNENKCDDCGLTIDEIFGLINCPQWAQYIWEINADKMQPLDIRIAIEDYLNFMSMESQVVAEWLELDQIDIFPLDQQNYWLIEFFKAERMMKSKEIKFFSDEI